MLWIINIGIVAMCGIFAAVIDRKNKQISVWKNMYDQADKIASNRLYERNAAVEQAKAFESVAKTMEEHLAAERSRADRLEKALLKMKQEEGQKASTPDGLSKEWANIFAYNGTGDGQEDVC